MKAEIRKIVVDRRGDAPRDGQGDRPADAQGRGRRRDQESLRRALCRGPRATDGHRRGTGRAAGRARGGRARRRAGEIESYGKAAIVGEKGEWEHAAAILHPRLGKPLRAAVEKGAALVPSAKKMGGLGTADRRAAGPQGRRLRAQPFRRGRDPHPRRPARRRDRRRRGGHRQRPPAGAGGRPAEERDQGRGRAALASDRLTSN